MTKGYFIPALVASALLAGVATASATPLTGTFHITVYQGVGDGTSTDPIEQANNVNPLLSLTTPVGSFTYTGALNFNSPPGANTVAGFIGTGGGTTAGFVPTTTLSTGNFADTTLFVITGSTSGAIIGGTVSHDDGASLYQGATTIFDSSSPTVQIPSTYSGLVGPFSLYYVEANGLPADLNFDVTSYVPEPAGIAILGAGLVGIGAMRRRRRA
jgi:hypothetical protein